jgi:LmbE family N-acetylglucosaminyl deacetylase
MSVLVVAAHPDDEVLGCGGTMARLAQEGEDVDVLILGEGATSRSATAAEADRHEVEALRVASREAADVLGVRDVVHGGLPDNRFDSVDLLDVVKLIEGELAERQPFTVYTQHGGDVNVDHRSTFAAVLAATRPVPGHSVREVLAFEVASSSEWAFATLAPAFQPSVFVDVTDHLDTKLEALGCYGTELRPFPHPRSLEGVRALATRHGTAVGTAAAEAFQPVRVIR